MTGEETTVVDIVTDLGSVDEDWHYLALTEDVRPGVDPTPGTRLVAGRDDDVWLVQIVEVSDDVIRFKLLERARVDTPDQRAAG